MMGSGNDIYRLREDEVDINGKAWDDDAVRLLAAKKILQFRKMVNYWRPLLKRGRKYENYYNGKILTDKQRAQYKKLGYVVMESPIMKAPIRALVGQALKSRKSGQITTERNTAASAPGSEAEIETLNIVMKDIENKTLEEYRIKEAIQSAFVSCYWNVLMFERVSPALNGDGARYKMTHLPWSSCVFGPQTIQEADGSDIKELFYYDYRTIADLIANYPDMEKQIVEHFKVGQFNDSKMLSSISQWETGLSSEDRYTMYDAIDSAETEKNSGLVQVVMHLFPIVRKDEVWVNIFDETGETFEMRPPEWNDERWNRWVRDNSQTYAGPVERETVTLWMTVSTMSGLVLFNGPHWFQENGKLPCSFWLGAIDGNEPTGPAADMADEVLGYCVGDIEALHEKRTGSGRTFYIKEGAIRDVEKFSREVSNSVSVAFIDRNFNGQIGEAIQEKQRTPNDTWDNFAEKRKQLMYENTRINETMLGRVMPRQSAVAKNMEIDQALTVNATLVDNINRSWEAHQNLKLKLIAYLYTEWELIEARDDKTGQMMQVEVNAPTEFDAEGNAVSVANDLTSHRYRWNISSVDDSPSAKTRHNEEALTVINAAAGPFAGADPTGGLFAEFLMSSDNPTLQRFGKALAERSQQAQSAQGTMEQKKLELEVFKAYTKAKADLRRALKHGFMTTLTGEDLQNNEKLYQMWITALDVFEKKADEELTEAQQLAAQQLAAPETAQTEAVQ